MYKLAYFHSFDFTIIISLLENLLFFQKYNNLDKIDRFDKQRSCILDIFIYFKWNVDNKDILNIRFYKTEI